MFKLDSSLFLGSDVTSKEAVFLEIGLVEFLLDSFVSINSSSDLIAWRRLALDAVGSSRTLPF